MTDIATTIWPADKVERRPIASLLPYANNARTHPPAQVAQLAKLIAAYGWTTPVLVDAKGVLIAGHGRILAAQSLGISEIPTMTATGWTAAQVKAYRLADNALAAQAGWDNALVLPELEALRIEGFDLELTGFAPDMLAGLLDPDSACVGGSGAGSLAAQFGIPPFSVLNAREGWWQERKRAWLALGIQSELGRGEGHEAIPGGAGAGAVVRDMGRSMRANATPGGGADARR